MHRPTRVRSILAGALVAVMVAACGGAAATPAASTTAAPSATASVAPSVAPSSSASASASASVAASPSASKAPLATTGLIEDHANGYALTLPDGWVRIDLSETDVAAIAKAAGDLSPEMAKAYSAQMASLLASGLVLFGLSTTNTQASVNLLKAPSSGLSLDLIAQVTDAQITALADGEVVSERVTLDAGEAAHYRYSLKAQAGTTIDQFLLVSETDLFALTVTNTKTSVATSIANSFAFLD